MWVAGQMDPEMVMQTYGKWNSEYSAQKEDTNLSITGVIISSQ